ncbi:hypothetical protein WR25_20228 [Diploscapter pachys]|uniref:Uncharacterized protein n=1 Tax=Diploscapter pachys TaxID=2018661 RepID=A0A2A2M5D5_9BILA|nr:hypothetical protein WR25_20228 [Diploscapter pachys]
MAERYRLRDHVLGMAGTVEERVIGRGDQLDEPAHGAMAPPAPSTPSSRPCHPPSRTVDPGPSPERRWKREHAHANSPWTYQRGCACSLCRPWRKIQKRRPRRSSIR